MFTDETGTEPFREMAFASDRITDEENDPIGAVLYVQEGEDEDEALAYFGLVINGSFARTTNDYVDGEEEDGWTV